MPLHHVRQLRADSVHDPLCALPSVALHPLLQAVRRHRNILQCSPSRHCLFPDGISTANTVVKTRGRSELSAKPCHAASPWPHETPQHHAWQRSSGEHQGAETAWYADSHRPLSNRFHATISGAYHKRMNLSILPFCYPTTSGPQPVGHLFTVSPVQLLSDELCNQLWPCLLRGLLGSKLPFLLFAL